MLKTVTIAQVSGCEIQRQQHIVTVPPLCPATGNPRSGSTVAIVYVPHAHVVLEVYSLSDYVRSFYGSETVRDIEQFAQVVAADCGQALGANTTVTVRFVLDIDQTVETTVTWISNKAAAT
jgi:NADPH-dependent 7-cyano-7-deazaguanine reductase QueF